MSFLRIKCLIHHAKKGLIASLLFASPIVSHADESTTDSAEIRKIMASAIEAPMPSEQQEIILSLKSKPSPEVVSWLDQWKEGSIYLYEAPDGKRTAVTLTGEADAEGTLATLLVADGTPLLDALSCDDISLGHGALNRGVYVIRALCRDGMSARTLIENLRQLLYTHADLPTPSLGRVPS